MKIAHLCLSNYYVDGFSYQENQLVRQHVEAGHTVKVIASTENLGRDGKLFYEAPGTYQGSDGATVTRLAYKNVPLARKIRAYEGVTEALADFAPQTVMFHGISAYALKTVADYCRKHRVRLFADTHADANNSAQGFVSRSVLHRGFYRYVVQSALPQIEKVLCVSLATLEFAAEAYGVPREKLEFYPLGGFIPDDDEYKRNRTACRAELGLGETDICIIQSGKFDAKKRLVESLRYFSAIEAPSLRLMLCGALGGETADEAKALIAGDPRIRFLGWKSADELTRILCAAEVYLQPGTMSATMQHALCCRCAVVLDDIPSHKPYVDGNGWLIDGSEDFSGVFSEMSRDPTQILRMASRSHEIASRMLDYRRLAERIVS